jgi:hypothetical protein
LYLKQTDVAHTLHHEISPRGQEHNKPPNPLCRGKKYPALVVKTAAVITSKNGEQVT